MVAKTFTVKNKSGLHMRAAQRFVREMSGYNADINIKFNGKSINGKSILGLMSGCIKYGSILIVECAGADEAAMLDNAAELFESGFGE